ncbi:DUF5819 family protein [Streptomyces sp. NPDC017086]|uniref:DUF5819 family protein n=1 Tax=Streptomyces sp. NPDC017086 TaxID=3364976 RepID=UPI0037885364
MDAYDEDAREPRAPGGPSGSRRPGWAPGQSPDPLPAQGQSPDPLPAQGPSPADPLPDQDQSPAPSPAQTQGQSSAPLRVQAQDRQSPDPSHAHAQDPSLESPESSPASAAAPSPPTGVAALSLGYQVGAALVVAVIAVATGVHLLMVFLSLAPSNTVTKQHGKAVERWVYPEFEQNWKLFAPNPLQQNIAVQVRAVVRARDGGLRTTGWTDLSAQDGAAIDGNPVPSHTQQNELRRAWDFFAATHGTDNRAMGLRGSLSEQYLRRIVVMRLYRDDPTSREGVIQRVQIRSSTTNVQPPPWSRERVPDKPVYRLLPWWSPSSDEAARGVR